jgi:hypothetical protein
VKLVFLHGPPGVGKLTVGRELAAITGYGLFHNHLVVNALLAVFEFGSPAFVELREEIWLAVFERAGDAGVPGLIFTLRRKIPCVPISLPKRRPWSRKAAATCGSSR